jgi:outer membrane protein OmpA-like peptidoglycan-associated protein
MKRRLAALTLGGIVALSGAAFAEDKDKSETTEPKNTVKKEDVKTWVVPIEGKDWSIRPAAPAFDGDTGLFHLSSAYTLPKGRVSFSLYRDNIDRDPKDQDISTFGLTFAYGATSKLELFTSLGLQNRIDADALFQPGYQNDYPFSRDAWSTGFGDVKLGAKFKFLDDYTHNDPVGLALKGMVKLPTADEQKGLGTGKASFDIDLILSKSLNRMADLHGSIGYEVNSDPSGVDIGNALKWGVGLNIPACRWLQLHAEVTGKKYSSASFPQTDPVDLFVGPALWIKPGFFIRPGFSWNMNFDDRGLNSGFTSKAGKILQIGYHPGTPCCQVYVPPPPPPPPANRPPTVSLNCAKESVLAGETMMSRATASDPDGDTLTYTWSASAGKVTGNGPEATFDSASVPCDTVVTITVTVSDGRGGTAQATCTVRVKCPEKPKPEPVTCTSGGFPRNMARLNNVDKACLDDLAARMKQDPRSRIIITGHADKTEANPEVIGRKRAEAIKSYLVKERGVDEARVTARSAGASKPLDTGTSAAARARNRRADVTFVPEGASLPEDDD